MLIDWTFWGSGIILGIFGLWVMYRAIFADRSRGRRRCPKCWYDMSESPEMRCPECGREVRNERSLGRTRRRYGLATTAGISLILATAAGVAPNAKRNGVISLVPNTVLIWSIDWINDSSPIDELWRRTEDMGAHWASSDPGTLSRRQWQWLTDQCVEALAPGNKSNKRNEALDMLYFWIPWHLVDMPPETATAISRSIADADVTVCENALSAFGNIVEEFDTEDEAAICIDAISDILTNSKSRNLQFSAFETLSGIYRTDTPVVSRSTPTLIELLQSEDLDVALSACDAICSTEFDAVDSVATAPLIEVLLHHDDEFLRAYAASAIECICPSDPVAIRALIDALHDPSPRVINAAFEAIRRIGGVFLSTGYDYRSYHRLNIPERDIGQFAEEILSEINRLALTEAHEYWAMNAISELGLYDQHTIEVLLGKTPTDHNSDRLIDALGSIGPEVVAALPMIVNRLSSKRWQDREAAIRAISLIAPDDATTFEIVLHAASTEIGIVRSEALVALRRYPSFQVRSLPALYDALLVSNSSLQVAAAESLAILAPADDLAVRTLRAMATDHEEDPEVRLASARAIYQISGDASAMATAFPDLWAEFAGDWRLTEFAQSLHDMGADALFALESLREASTLYRNAYVTPALLKAIKAIESDS